MSRTDVSDMSGKDTPDPEKELDVDRDIEKQIEPLPLSPAAQDKTVPTEEKDPSLVEFDGPGDPDNPKNWTARRRIIISALMGLMTFVVTFSSSIFAVAIEPVAKEYNVSTVVSTLGVTLFLLVSAVITTDLLANLHHINSTRVSSWVR